MFKCFAGTRCCKIKNLISQDLPSDLEEEPLNTPTYNSEFFIFA